MDSLSACRTEQGGFIMRISEEEYQELRKRIINDFMEETVQDLSGSYIWTQIQRIACLMNGYSLQRWVQDHDAEKVANTAKDLCEAIIQGFKERNL